MYRMSVPLLLLLLLVSAVPVAGAEVLFEHQFDSEHWRYLHDGSLFGRLTNIKNPDGEGLLMSIPAERKRTEIGIGTKVPRVWLDDFGPEASVSLTFALDAEHSDRFSLHLIQSAGEWSLSQAGMVFYWQPDPAGEGSVYGWYETPSAGNKPPAEHPQGHTERKGPQQVTITITPGQVSVQTDDLPALSGPWSLARPHAGFYLFVYTQTASDGLPASLKLKRIALSRRPDRSRDPLPPADAMFPATDLLAPGAEARWNFTEEDATDLAGFARLAAGAMEVAVPEKHGWGRAGYTSAEPLAHVDPLVDEAPYLVELALDPAQTSGLYFVLGDKGQQLYDDNVRRTRFHARFSVIRLPKEDHFTLQVRHGYYHNWVRPLPADWDGRLQVVIGWRYLTVQVPGGPGVRGDLPPPTTDKRGKPYFLTLLAAPPRSSQPSRFLLKALTVRQLVGSGFDPQTRFLLVPPARFDAGAYLETLGQRTRRALGDALDAAAEEVAK